MIIIAENKKSHYLIKKFLLESGIEDDSSRRYINLTPVSDQPPGSDPDKYVQTGLKPVGQENVYVDKETVDEESKEFEALTAIAPKYNKLASYASRGMITLGMIVALWNSIPDHVKFSGSSQGSRQTYSAQQEKAESEVKAALISQKPEEKSEIDRTFGQIQNNDVEEDLTFSIEYDQSTDKEKVKQSILRHEGFKGLPYPDHHQWSVGHGTKVFSDADLDEGEHAKLKKEYRKAVKSGNLGTWVEKEIPGWRKKFFDTYSIQDDNASSTSPVNLQQAGIAADQEINHVIDQMKKVKYFKVLPQDTKQAFYDMAYNMGPGFLKKFKNFNETMQYAAIVLDSKDLNEEEVKVAINLFEIAAREILYNFNEDGTIKGKTKYHGDLEDRSLENYELVKKGIEDIRISISPRNFQDQNSNESLKRVYKHLFV